mmetsp:Transcript_1921/g.7719  ORF Transcript_1921/g.7719 Transcript_1921/m.7719 type:complete len:266 (-) Transcript_1921:140-937(-)
MKADSHSLRHEPIAEDRPVLSRSTRGIHDEAHSAKWQTRGVKKCQSTSKPPFMSNTSPVMNPESLLARNMTACANSSGSQNRPTGIFLSVSCRCASVSCSMIMGVRTYAGAMAFTVTPSFALSFARLHVSVFMAPLLTLYAVPAVSPPFLPASELVLIMRPHLAARMPGRTALAMRKLPVRLTRITRSNSSTLVAELLLLLRIPALFKSTLGGAHSAASCAMAELTAPSSDTSSATPLTCGLRSAPSSFAAAESASAERSTIATR